MHTKQKWRRMAPVIAAVLFMTMAMPVMATGGEATVEDTGSTNYNPGSDVYTPTVDNGFDDVEIEVQASSTGAADIVYNMKIEWGAMKFVYSYGSTWNPATHTYSTPSGTTDTEGWIKDGYVDGENNKITITNNSNFPMNADLTYDDSTAVKDLNKDKKVSGAVIGVFSASNANFTPEVLSRGYNRVATPIYATEYKNQIHLEMDASKLDQSKDKYFYSHYAGGGQAKAEDGTGHKDVVYFALSGKPDASFSDTFVKVGTIKVAISPAPVANRVN